MLQTTLWFKHVTDHSMVQTCYIPLYGSNMLQTTLCFKHVTYHSMVQTCYIPLYSLSMLNTTLWYKYVTFHSVVLLLLLVRQMEIPVSPMKVAVHRRSLRLPYSLRATLWFKQVDNNNKCSQRRNSRFLTISSLRRKLSPTCMLKWPRRICVQIT